MTWWVDTFGSVGAALAIATVFFITFAIVGGLGYLFLLRGRTPGHSPTESRTTEPPEDADRESTATVGWNVASPAVTAGVEDGVRIDEPNGPLDGPASPSDPVVVVRGAAVNAYRWLLIALGVIGLVGGLALIRSHTSANLLALPGGIVLLLGLGALLSGLFPNRALTGSFGTIGFRPLVNRISVRTGRDAPLQLQLSDDQRRRAVDLIKEGLPISEAARTVYPDFDRLDVSARQAMESDLQQASRQG